MRQHAPFSYFKALLTMPKIFENILGIHEYELKKKKKKNIKTNVMQVKVVVWD